MKAFSLRRFSALIAILALFFAQLAVSAYACPGVSGMKAAEALAEDAPPCHQSPTPGEQTPLCQAHCQQADQSLDLRGASVPAACFLALPVAWVPLQVPEAAPTAAGAQASLLERPTGPPLAVRHCRFLI